MFRQRVATQGKDFFKMTPSEPILFICHCCGESADAMPGCEACRLPTCPRCLTVTNAGRFCRDCKRKPAGKRSLSKLFRSGLVRMLDAKLETFS